MRYERKYSLSNISPEIMQQMIFSHPAAFQKLFPDRQVNNVYLDTPSLTTYRENIMGISHRRKFRMRWYGSDNQRLADPVFEIKIKENQLGRKETYPVGNLSWQQLPGFFAGFAPVWRAGVQPVLVNAYRRAYYGSADGRFRMTLDWNLAFGSYTPWQYSADINPINLLILELKYDESSEDYLDRITQYLPFRPTKSSKYVTGIQMTLGGY